MKKLTFILLACFTWILSLAQVDVPQLFSQHPELIIKFQMQDKEQMKALTRMVSIDKVTGNEVIAYTTQEEFAQFLELNIPYEIVERPVLFPEELNMLDFEAIKNCRNDWNYYPDYNAYLEMMAEFAENYPNLCRMVEFGTSVQNKKLLSCVISSNVHVREAEPQVFWSSTMHGDEMTGYVLMLRYIDYLLSNYGTDAQVTNLLDNLEIWICPLANPDGTFWSSGARRNNANNYDLNRNYPDWINGTTPGGTRQKETIAFMALQDEQTFVMGVNVHGGTEVCNYTWDNTCTVAPLPADDDWWLLVCREYVDTVHYYSQGSSYMRDNHCTSPYCPPPYACYPGICSGAYWYFAEGSRQDYANYYNHNREFTLEISYTKTPSAGSLPTFWNRNYRSFLNYTQQALYGFQGTVTDACSGEPAYAKIFINGHDIDNSYVMTDPRVGYYARLIKGGTYSVTCSADGYISQTLSITVTDKQKVIQNFSLLPEGVTNVPVADFDAEVTEIFVNEGVHFTDQSSENTTSWEWYFEGGTPEESTEQNPTVVYKNSGVFNVILKAVNETCANTMVKPNFIIVKQTTESPIANFAADKTEIAEKETVYFSNLSEKATDFEWYFAGGTPETSSEINPAVMYENEGTFTVKLTAINDYSNDILEKTNYITVTPLAIHELEEMGVKIFPNPVSQEAMLTIETDDSVVKMELMNLLGVIVKTTVPIAAPYTFSVAGVARGSYLMKVETTKGSLLTKIQIQ